jgi:hypothetical protein
VSAAADEKRDAEGAQNLEKRDPGIAAIHPTRGVAS